MTHSCRFSNVTKEYLNTFDEILDCMIQDMTGAKLADSISQNFIVQMIPHHEAAIEMSRNLLRFTTSLPLQDIACRIIEEQTQGIEEMRQSLDCCSQLCSTEEQLCAYHAQMEPIFSVMFGKMRSAYSGNDINCNFMREMIPHHRGAVEMASTALRYPICPELKPILQNIIIQQKKGIQQMQGLLRCMC